MTNDLQNALNEVRENIKLVARRLEDVEENLYGDERRGYVGVTKELRSLRELCEQIQKDVNKISFDVGRIKWIAIGFGTALSALGGLITTLIAG